MGFLTVLLVCQLFVSQAAGSDLNNIIHQYREYLSKSHNNEQLHMNTPGVDPECNMNFCQISNYHGYKCEEYLHQVETDDGFLLTLHRLTGRKGEKSNSTRPPVFVQHGLLCDSTSWILNLPNQSLPFVLSDEGFDVWVANSRGNTYSRAHKTLKPDTDAFWAWSWDEMARYDIPASIDFVLNHTTGYESLHYVGHSQGTLIAFVHLSLNPNYKKISHMIALGPVFHVSHMISPIKYAAPVSKELAFIFKLFGIRDFLPNNWFFEYFADAYCNKPERLNHAICGDILFVLAGFDVKQLNETRVPVYINHTPAGTSVRDMIHFGQMYEDQQTARFDYGSDHENMKHYNSTKPPAYSINPINTTVSLFYSQNDWLADVQDVKYIQTNLKTIKNNMYIPAWNHLDFIWGLDANTILYDKIVNIIKEETTPPAK